MLSLSKHFILEFSVKSEIYRSGLLGRSGTEVKTKLVKQAKKRLYNPAKVVKNSLFLEGLSRRESESTGHIR